MLFFGTLEPRKNVGGLLDAYELLIRSARQASAPLPPPLILAGRATETPRAGSIGSTVGLCGHRAPYRLCRCRRSGAPSTQGARLLVQPSFEEGFGLPVLEAMTARRSGRRGQSRRAAGSARRCGTARRSRSAGRHRRRVFAGCWTTTVRGRRAPRSGIARARGFQWDETARRVYATYQQAIDTASAGPDPPDHAHRHRRARIVRPRDRRRPLSGRPAGRVGG